MQCGGWCRRYAERFAALVAFVSVIAFTACAVYESHRTTLDSAELARSDTTLVLAPGKVHLRDGSVVVFAHGFEMVGDALSGAGLHFDLLRAVSDSVRTVPVDSILGLEYFRVQHNPSAEMLTAVPYGVGGAVAAWYLALLIFGSCPTVYTVHDGGVGTLQAELFSYSIGPVFEAPDLDRLDDPQPRDGCVRLRLADEALETHYVNRVALEVVDHDPRFSVFPTPDCDILLAGEFTPLLAATDRHGRDVSAALATADGECYRSDPRDVEGLADSLSRDWIELELDVPAGADSAIVGFRLRNTLLNTVLLYDVLLGAQGARALDWMQHNDRHPIEAMTFALWYQQHFGMRLRWAGESHTDEAAFIPDTGPIAWHDFAVALPVRSGKRARLRLDFLPDNWIIDWIGVSFEPGRADAIRSVPCRAVRDAAGAVCTGRAESLQRVDDRRLMLQPGQECELEFAVPPPAGAARSWLLRSNGYYVEWIRGSWIREAAAGPAVPAPRTDTALLQRAAGLWLQKKADLEQRFFEAKVPIAGRSR